MKFVYNFFLPQILYISRMKTSLNRTTIFKLIVHGIELYAAFEKRENKQKNAKLWLKKLELSFFSHKFALVMQFCWEKIDNSKLLNVYKHKGLVPMFTNKDFYGWFQLCLLLNPFQNGLYIFGWLSVRIPLEFHVK